MADGLADQSHQLSSLVVKCTAGAHPAEAERCNQALTVAATAVASGLSVSLWLTGEATWLVVPGRADQLVLPHAQPAAALVQAVLDAGTVTACGQCATRRDITEAKILPGVRIAGAAAFLAESMDPSARVLIY